MIVLDGIRIALSAFPLDLFGFEKHTSLTGSGGVPSLSRPA
jgi:hypothetical protein